MSFSKRIINNILKEERAKLMSGLRQNPIKSFSTLLDKAGLDYTQKDNKFYISIGGSDTVTITVEREEK